MSTLPSAAPVESPPVSSFSPPPASGFIALDEDLWQAWQVRRRLRSKLSAVRRRKLFGLLAAALILAVVWWLTTRQ